MCWNYTILKYNKKKIKIMTDYEHFVKIHLQGKERDILALRKCKYYNNCAFKTLINWDENVL